MKCSPLSKVRFDIERLVKAIEPIDEVEAEHKADTVDWIASGAPLFRVNKPADPPKHLVSYVVPIDLEQQKILLVHHRKSELWLPPGGHVDVDEHPKVTAKRELKEELFVDLPFLIDEPLFLTVTGTVGRGVSHIDVSLWYLFSADSREEYGFDEEEFFSVKWFSLDQLPSRGVEPHLGRFVHKLKKSMSNCLVS